MYLLANFHETDPTRIALMRSGLELLAEKGYRGATTKEIASAAGVSEVTLFRQFKSKEILLSEAFQKIAPPADQVFPTPSGNLEKDLLSLTQAYQGVLEANKGLLMRLLPEIARHPELRGENGSEGMRLALQTGMQFILHYQKTGQLRKENPFQATATLVGPIFIKTMFINALGLEIPFDLKLHVSSFIQGRAPNSKKPK